MLGLVPRTASSSSKNRHVFRPCCLGFLLSCTFVPGCEFWFCIATLYACNRCHYVLRQCSPKYSAFYLSAIIAVVFLHRPIFQLNIWPPNSPNFGSIGQSPPLRIRPPFWTCLVWSRLKLPLEVVSIMLRIIMFQPWFAQCTAWCEHFS